MERHRGVTPCGSAPSPGKNVSQHLRNGALSSPRKVPREEKYRLACILIQKDLGPRLEDVEAELLSQKERVR